MNILIIGLGSIARKHIEALSNLNLDVKIYALRSKLNVPAEGNVENIYELENCDLVFDFAIISNPTQLHFQFIEKLAQKGIPLFIEKPAIHILENVNKLVDLIKEKHLITYVACNLRFHPCILFLKDKIDKDSLRINELNVYCGSYLPDWRPGKDFRTIYSSNSAMGGGVHLDLFHELDYTAWIFGLPNKSNVILRNKSSLEIDAIDYANYTLEYDSFVANIILNYYRRSPKREIEIVFEKDTWVVDLINNEIKNDNGDVFFRADNFNVKDTYLLQLKYFIGCINNNQVPMNSFDESVEILKICLNNEFNFKK
jgi:predicted dehydrogenase